jgi:hypothetical protein
MVLSTTLTAASSTTQELITQVEMVPMTTVTITMMIMKATMTFITTEKTVQKQKCLKKI